MAYSKYLNMNTGDFIRIIIKSTTISILFIGELTLGIWYLF
ncbi:hypothetical protein LCGC14_2372000 [marine sediment metagenome]|uniref:Uncharacterized protein n=1 Tax=marine sediment metagenome TaxID=412755 RepID=A0A0F9EFZ8_9ZZZZ